MEPDAEYVPLTPVKQKGGKTVHAWGFEGDRAPDTFVSNTFTIEWPPRSRKQQEFSEVDRAEFFDIETARTKINTAQAPFLDELALVVTAR